MVRWCAVVGCNSNSNALKDVKNPTYKLYTFPTERKNNELRLEWIKALSRKDYVPDKYSRVCSLHFVNGMNKNESEVPALNLGYVADITPKRPPPRERVPSSNKKKRLKLTPGRIVDLDHSYDYICDCVKNCPCTGCVMKEREIKKLQSNNEYLKEKADQNENKCKHVSPLDIYLSNDKKAKKYTGCVSVQQFNDLFQLVSPGTKKLKYWYGVKRSKTKTGKKTRKGGDGIRRGAKRKISHREELLLVLMK